MSYALDAGRNAHGIEGLTERWLGHAVVDYGGLTGSGKNKLPSIRSRSTRRPSIRPKAPTRSCGCGAC